MAFCWFSFQASQFRDFITNAMILEAYLLVFKFEN